MYFTHLRSGILLAASIGLGVVAMAGGQAEATESQRLEPIEISSSRLTRDWLETPASVSVVHAEQIHEGRQHLQLDETLNRVPGVHAQNRYNFAQNLRISMRGFGARAPFGIRGVHILLDGFAETLPDGQSQTDIVDLESVERIEVIRGPASTLYGNAAGGVLAITTLNEPAAPYVELRSTVGSDDFLRYGLRAGGRSGALSTHVSVWDLSYEGYRSQSRVEKRLLNGKLGYDLGADRRLSAVFTALDAPVGEDPGGLTLEEVRANRRQANPLSLQMDAGQAVEHQRLGVLYRDAASLSGELNVRAFYSQRDFDQQLPTLPGGANGTGGNNPQLKRELIGAGLDYTDAVLLAGVPLRYTAGFEAARQEDDRRRARVSEAGFEHWTQDELQTATSLAAFGQLDVGLSERLELTLGGRFDRVRLEIDDRFHDGAGSGRRDYDEPSLSAGLTYRLLPLHSLYANVGTAFETPTFTEVKEAKAAPASNATWSRSAR
ncbi:hypothetical protein CAI21_18030 [Alkalilimnicola ehrlichii]|uniref:TonB-dependent receptor n=1 Tax=Alkalilimnicola ehrlichii TaxID=351052 RepID=A0A3E0WLR4_9GAMM|nr:TonB-dependent receptor [Alkalilimnicola ehrlichii]RFA25855.1 hypothetical protein CAI21_18030 [Alkalilimnicola ehrlichii]RFA33091.1 hypothetical protein CAL65_18150 [Alkalilimnicola ehrlichii]